MVKKCLTTLVIALAATVALAADAIQIKAEPVFDGAFTTRGVWPLMVEIVNKGGDAQGVLVPNGSNYTVAYPVDLPQGAVKRFIVYPEGTNGVFKLELSTNRGSFSEDVSLPPQYMPWSDSSQQYIGVIGDASGDYAFVRTRVEGSEEVQRPGMPAFAHNAMNDSYALPANAPDRMQGYDEFTSIILDSGSERLSNTQVAALQSWVLNGGTLIIPGGASTPLLSDPRWAKMLPIQDIQRQTVTPGQAQALFNLKGLDASVTVTTGTLQANGIKMTGGYLRRIGLGNVVVLAVNPTDLALTRWSDRGALVQRFVRKVDTSAASNMVREAVSVNDYRVQSGGFVHETADPFQIKPPSMGQLFPILIGYFVLAIPLTFLVLRKFKRLELAWVITPVISFAAAGTVLASTSKLYSAQQSTYTRSLTVLHPDVMVNSTSASAQIFFPHGGNYDLNLRGVDSIAPLNGADDYSYGFRESNYQRLNPIDNGSITMPQVAVSNLAFQRLYFRQNRLETDWLPVVVESASKEKLVVRVENRGALPVEDNQLFWNGRFKKIPNIQPGQTTRVELTPGTVPSTRKDDSRSQQDLSSGLMRISNDSNVVLYGHIPRVAGPQAGRELSSALDHQVCAFGTFEVKR